MNDSKAGRGKLHKVDGKRYPVVAELVVRITNNVELYGLDGERFSRPHREARLEVSIERDGKQVGIGHVVLAEVLAQFTAPKPPTPSYENDPDEFAFLDDLRGIASEGRVDTV